PGRGLIDQVPAPHFGLVRPAGMPDGDRAGLARVQRRIRENFAGAADEPRPLASFSAPLLLAMREIFGDDRRVLIRKRRRPVPREKIDAGLMAPLIKRDLQ